MDDDTPPDALDVHEKTRKEPSCRCTERGSVKGGLERRHTTRL